MIDRKVDFFGVPYKIGDYLIAPDKYGGSRVQEMRMIVKENPKSFRVVRVTEKYPEGYSPASNMTNFEQGVILNDKIKHKLGLT